MSTTPSSPPSATCWTRALKATVEAAFDQVLALDRRRRALLAERGAQHLPADPAERLAAWR